ncbi:MAG: ribosomal-protein-alanine N-acetyltransferase [Candidatus Paceibacteria bacterium]|jgi:ribosomal-protein-alanine N-acetyltransferase
MSQLEHEDHDAGLRVYLRTPLMADHAEYVAVLKASAEFHKPWSPVPPPNVDIYSEDAFTQYVRSTGLSSRRERRFICRRSDDRILGAIHVSEIVRGCFQSAYLGYWMGAEFAGQGYMGEGLRLTLGLCFGEWKLHRVEANVRPENEPSIRLVRGAGFKLEGLSPRYLNIDGDWRDHERWALLADEFSS